MNEESSRFRIVHPQTELIGPHQAGLNPELAGTQKMGQIVPALVIWFYKLGCNEDLPVDLTNPICLDNIRVCSSLNPSTCLRKKPALRFIALHFLKSLEYDWPRNLSARNEINDPHSGLTFAPKDLLDFVFAPDSLSRLVLLHHASPKLRRSAGGPHLN